MSDVVATVLLELGEFVPAIVSMALLVVFQTVRKVLRGWLGIDVSNDDAILGLISLILVVTYSTLVIEGREVPGHSSVTVGSIVIGLVVVVILRK